MRENGNMKCSVKSRDKLFPIRRQKIELTTASTGNGDDQNIPDNNRDCHSVLQQKVNFTLYIRKL